MRVLNKDETPLLYSLVFGGGVVNDATSVVLFNAIQGSDLSPIDSSVAFSVNWQRLVLTHLQYHAWVFWYVVSLFFVSILASRLMIQFYLFIILLPSLKNLIGKSNPLPRPSPCRFWTVDVTQRLIQSMASRTCLGRQACAWSCAPPHTQFTITGESMMLLSWDRSLGAKASCLAYRSLQLIKDDGHW